MTCTCFAEMNERLKPHNAKIANGFNLCTIAGKTTIRLSYFVATEKLDTNVRGKKKPPLVVMTHCPFCSTKLEDDA